MLIISTGNNTQKGHIKINKMTSNIHEALKYIQVCSASPEHGSWRNVKHEFTILLCGHTDSKKWLFFTPAIWQKLSKPTMYEIHASQMAVHYQPK
jgi:hypothetical protein